MSEEIAENQAADHFLSFHPVHQLTDKETEEGCDRHGDGHGSQESGKAADAPFNDPQRRDLCRHGADGDGKVDSHSGNDRNDQSQNNKGVSA